MNKNNGTIIQIGHDDNCIWYLQIESKYISTEVKKNNYYFKNKIYQYYKEEIEDFYRKLEKIDENNINERNRIKNMIEINNDKIIIGKNKILKLYVVNKQFNIGDDNFKILFNTESSDNIYYYSNMSYKLDIIKDIIYKSEIYNNASLLFHLYFPNTLDSVHHLLKIARKNGNRYFIKMDIENAYYSVNIDKLLCILLKEVKIDSLSIKIIRELYSSYDRKDNSNYLYLGFSLSSILFKFYLSYILLQFYKNNKFSNIIFYMDDIIIYGENFLELLDVFLSLTKSINDYNLYLNNDKIHFFDIENDDIIIFNRVMLCNNNNKINKETKNFILGKYNDGNINSDIKNLSKEIVEKIFDVENNSSIKNNNNIIFDDKILLLTLNKLKELLLHLE